MPGRGLYGSDGLEAVPTGCGVEPKRSISQAPWLPQRASTSHRLAHPGHLQRHDGQPADQSGRRAAYRGRSRCPAYAVGSLRRERQAGPEWAENLRVRGGMHCEEAGCRETPVMCRLPWSTYEGRNRKSGSSHHSGHRRRAHRVRHHRDALSLLVARSNEPPVR
jgi:hypothetical protein